MKVEWEGHVFEVDWTDRPPRECPVCGSVNIRKAPWGSWCENCRDPENKCSDCGQSDDHEPSKCVSILRAKLERTRRILATALGQEQARAQHLKDRLEQAEARVRRLEEALVPVLAIPDDDDPAMVALRDDVRAVLEKLK